MASGGSTVSRLSSDQLEPIQPSLDSAPQFATFKAFLDFSWRPNVSPSYSSHAFSYQSSCSLIHTYSAAFIFWLVRQWLYYSSKWRDPSRVITGYFGCAHPGPCGGRLHGLYLLSVNSLGQNFQVNWIYTVGCWAGTLAWSLILEHTQHTFASKCSL